MKNETQDLIRKMIREEIENVIDNDNSSVKETIKKQVLDFVEKKTNQTATWKEIHAFILTLKGLDPNDPKHRGKYSSYFSNNPRRQFVKYGPIPTETANLGLLLRPSKNDPRRLVKIATGVYKLKY